MLKKSLKMTGRSRSVKKNLFATSPPQKDPPDKVKVSEKSEESTKLDDNSDEVDRKMFKSSRKMCPSYEFGEK